jgi:hypothetical protein
MSCLGRLHRADAASGAAPRKGFPVEAHTDHSRDIRPTFPRGAMEDALGFVPGDVGMTRGGYRDFESDVGRLRTVAVAAGLVALRDVAPPRRFASGTVPPVTVAARPVAALPVARALPAAPVDPVPPPADVAPPRAPAGAPRGCFLCGVASTLGLIALVAVLLVASAALFALAIAVDVTLELAVGLVLGTAFGVVVDAGVRVAVERLGAGLPATLSVAPVPAVVLSNETSSMPNSSPRPSATSTRADGGDAVSDPPWPALAMSSFSSTPRSVNRSSGCRSRRAPTP